MSKIVILGAGAMGTAFAYPCLDNNHEISIVGTHLENEFIDKIKQDFFHSGLNLKISILIVLIMLLLDFIFLTIML